MDSVMENDKNIKLSEYQRSLLKYCLEKSENKDKKIDILERISCNCFKKQIKR